MTTNKEWLFSLPLEEQIAWMESEHYEPNPDYTENMKHEPCSDYEPKDDAVSIMRECAEMGHSMRVLRGRLGVECVTGWQMRCLCKLADMVERDYVRRDAIEEVMDNDRALVEENAKLASELEAAKLQIGQSDAPKSEETPENHAPKREIRDFDVSERHATAFKWLDRLNYGKGGVIDKSLCDTPEQGEVVMPLENWREYLDTEPENEDSRERLEADVFKAADDMEMFYNGERFIDTRKIIGWLDRQAAITERECIGDAGKASMMGVVANERECYGKRIAELTAERDKLQEQLLIGWECECRLQAERERYRSKFGKCLDYADAIHALMDDEGMA